MGKVCAVLLRDIQSYRYRLIVQLIMMRQQDLPMSSVDATAVKLASLEPAVRSLFDFC